MAGENTNRTYNKAKILQLLPKLNMAGDSGRTCTFAIVAVCFPFRQVNCLFLGRQGNGKSSLINSIYQTVTDRSACPLITACFELKLVLSPPKSKGTFKGLKLAYVVVVAAIFSVWRPRGGWVGLGQAPPPPME